MRFGISLLARADVLAAAVAPAAILGPAPARALNTAVAPVISQAISIQPIVVCGGRDAGGASTNCAGIAELPRYITAANWVLSQAGIGRRHGACAARRREPGLPQPGHQQRLAGSAL